MLLLRYIVTVSTILVSFVWLWPITHRFLRPLNYGKPVTAAAGFGLSIGVLSLYMMTLGLLPGLWLRPVFVLPLPWLVLAYEGWLWKMRVQKYGGKRASVKDLRASVSLLSTALSPWLSLICISGLMVILINTVSYPFYRDDVLSRFAPNARLLFETSYIPVTLTGYPLAVQLMYAFAFMASGEVNDHMAGMVVAAFAGAMILVTFAIGNALFPRRAAWMAIFLLLSSPLFVDWSTSGYVDVPVGVYHGLTFLFAFSWVKGGERHSAVLTGVMAGLALWTKQSALVMIIAIAIVPLLRGWPRRNIRAEISNSLVALTVMTLIAGPWYIRNLLLDGIHSVLPAPGAYDAQFVDHSLQSLLTFIGDITEWGVCFSAAAMVGISLWLSHMLGLRGPPHRSEFHIRYTLLLAAFIVPYHLIWWKGFSYQTRYLLASAPMYAALAGYGADWIIRHLPSASRIPRWSIIVIASVAVLLGSYKRIGAVYHLIIHPLQNDDAKLTRLSPESWSLVKHIRETIDPGSRLYVMDGTLAYWLHEYELLQDH